MTWSKLQESAMCVWQKVLLKTRRSAVRRRGLIVEQLMGDSGGGVDLIWVSNIRFSFGRI